MSGFNILDLLEQNEPQGLDICMINVDNIEPSRHNFYDVSEIKELKESIRMFGNIQPSLVCSIAGQDRYRMISGHRRQLAHIELVAEGYDQFEQMPCIITDGDPDANDIKGRLLLLLMNATSRELKDWEKAQQVQDMRDILEQYKNQGNDVPGGLRKYIAETLKVSETQVQRFESINKGLNQDLKEEFKAGTIGVSVAAELATLEPEQQQKAKENIKNKGTMTIKEARQLQLEIIPSPPAQEQVEAKLEQQTIHNLKCLSHFYEATAKGIKNFEYRQNDRDYKIGDFILLQEWDEITYTGREKQLQITYILDEMVPAGFVILGTMTLN